MLVWALLIGIPAIVIQQESYLGLPTYFFVTTAIFHAGIFYLNAYFLYPQLLTRKRWWLYILSLALVVFLSFHAKLLLLNTTPDFRLTKENRGLIAFGIMPYLAGSIIFRLISDRLKFERLEKEARAEQLSSELKFLRSQISPHFLFNMMTNMVALARRKSDILEPSLIRLSDLLRYMLYDSQHEKVPISTEIENIKNYVELQDLRFGEDIEVKLDISADDENQMIEPMLLIPFIENAFKHGVTIQKDAYIHIGLKKNKNMLEFSVVNNYNRENQSKEKNSGIGLENVKNRLKLLYPGKHQICIDDDHRVFAVKLQLDLS